MLSFVDCLALDARQELEAREVLKALKKVGRNMRPIHDVFKSWLQSTINSQAQEVINALAPSMPTWDLYRLIVPDERLRDVLQAAAIHMDHTPQINTSSFTLSMDTLGVTRAVPFTLTMPVPPGWSTILFPSNHQRATIGFDRKLTDVLAPSIREAQAWVTLQHVTKALLTLTNDRAAIRDMFPWVVELVKECDWSINRQRFYRWHGIGNNKAEQEKCDLTFKAALELRRGAAPVMTRTIREVCSSGTKLFAQVRMLKAVSEKNFEAQQTRPTNMASLVPNLERELIPASVTSDLDAIKEYKNYG